MSAHDVIREGNQFYPPSYMPQNGIDYVYSPSRIHIGVLEENGDFTIYGGTSPDDPAKVKVWSTESGRNLPAGYVVTMLELRKGPFDRNTKSLQIFGHDPNRGSTLTKIWGSGGSGDLQSPIVAVLGDDGMLSLRQNDRDVWNNGFSDPVVEFVVEKIEYDTPHAHITSDSDFGVLEQVLVNKTETPQQMTMSRETTTTIGSSWSNATGFSSTITGSVTAEVPDVASATVTMSATVTNTFTIGGSKSTSTKIGFSYPLTVPGKKTYKGWAAVRQAEFDVPYTVVGELRFRSGRKAKGQLSGTYKGKTGYLGSYNVEDITDGEAKPVRLFRMAGPANSADQIVEALEVS
jgi:hypothetical protein